MRHNFFRVDSSSRKQARLQMLGDQFRQKHLKQTQVPLSASIMPI